MEDQYTIGVWRCSDSVMCFLFLFFFFFLLILFSSFGFEVPVPTYQLLFLKF
jgi:hypothetical protein